MSKSENRKRRELNKSTLTEALERLQYNGFTYLILNCNRSEEPTQIRIDNMLDLYPVNKKWHNIHTAQRGVYSIDHFDFAVQYLTNKI